MKYSSFAAASLVLSILSSACVLSEEEFEDPTIGETSWEITFNGHDYLFVVTPKTWHEALNRCVYEGYNLVSINSVAEENFLDGEQARHGGGIWWIGYSDIGVENSWVWSDGSPTEGHINWHPNEPNNDDNQDCAVDDYKATGLWDDYWCHKSVKFICERGTVSSTNNGSFNYFASNTNSAQQNTANWAVNLSPGEILTVGTCGVHGASRSGDTYLRVYSPNGQQLAYNDDACGGYGSNVSIVAPIFGTYMIRAGCYGSGSCSGTVAYTR